MNIDYFYGIATICTTVVICVSIAARYGIPARSGELYSLRSNITRLEAMVNHAQQLTQQALHELSAERLESAKTLRALDQRFEKIETGMGTHEKAIVNMAAEFKTAVQDVRQESSKLSLMHAQQPRRPL